MSIGYVTDITDFYGLTEFSKYNSTVYGQYHSNGNIVYKNGFKNLIKGKYLLQYYLRVKITTIGTYLLGADIIRRREEGASSHVIIWDRSTNHEFSTHDYGEICTLTNTIIFDISDNFDSSDSLDLFIYLTDYSSFFIPVGHMSVYNQNTCATIQKIM